MKSNIIDIHTHGLTPKAHALNSVMPDKYVPVEGMVYSVGIHPWYITEEWESALDRIREIASHDDVLAIGETGIDHLSKIPVAIQAEVFRRHVMISEELRKPLVIHNVKSTDEILSVRKELRPDMPWIMHGFRGKPQMASQLVSQGLFVSFGEKYNSASLSAVPLDRLLVETDESSRDILNIYSGIASVIGMCRDEIMDIVGRNIYEILKR